MKENSFRIRGLFFAILLGPPRTLPRPEAVSYFARTCDEVGFDDLSFKYEGGSSEATASDGFKVSMERKAGKGGLTITLEGKGAGFPMRFLFQSLWPASTEVVQQEIDGAVRALAASLPGTVVVMTEARLRGHCNASGGKALDFLVANALRLPDKCNLRLDGRLRDAGLSLEVFPEPTIGSDVAGGIGPPTRRSINIETLKDDERDLYVDVMAQWGLSPLQGGGVPGTQVSSPRRADEPAGGLYVADIIKYTRERVLTLFAPELRRDANDH